MLLVIIPSQTRVNRINRLEIETIQCECQAHGLSKLVACRHWYVYVCILKISRKSGLFNNNNNALKNASSKNVGHWILTQRALHCVMQSNMSLHSLIMNSTSLVQDQSVRYTFFGIDNVLTNWDADVKLLWGANPIVITVHQFKIMIMMNCLSMSIAINYVSRIILEVCNADNWFVFSENPIFVYIKHLFWTKIIEMMILLFAIIKFVTKLITTMDHSLITRFCYAQACLLSCSPWNGAVPIFEPNLLSYSWPANIRFVFSRRLLNSNCSKRSFAFIPPLSI